MRCIWYFPNSANCFSLFSLQFIQIGNCYYISTFDNHTYSPDASLYQYYMIVLQTFGVHYAQRYTSIGRVCRNICSISIECTNSSVFRVLYIRTQNYIKNKIIFYLLYKMRNLEYKMYII